VGWYLVALLVTLAVAFVVITQFSEDEEHEPDEGHLEDLLDP